MLGTVQEIVWATTWGHRANAAISPLLGLGTLPVIEFDRGRAGDTWKLPNLSEFAGDRAAAWVDDELFGDARSWAEHRDAPTLLVRTMSTVGLTEIHVAELEGFAGAVIYNDGDGLM